MKKDDEKILLWCLITFVVTALLLLCVLSSASIYQQQIDVDTEQLNEMLDYHLSQGRDAVIEDGYIVIKTN